MVTQFGLGCAKNGPSARRASRADTPVLRMTGRRGPRALIVGGYREGRPQARCCQVDDFNPGFQSLEYVCVEDDMQTDTRPRVRQDMCDMATLATHGINYVPCTVAC